MRTEGFRPSENVEDRRSLDARLVYWHPEQHLAYAPGSGGYLQRQLTAQAAGLGADLPPPGTMQPAALGYRPNVGPELPPVQTAEWPEYRKGGPERDDVYNYLRTLYGR